MQFDYHDTLDGFVRPFVPPRTGPVRIYVCGPTVYDRAHVGHARTYLYFDLVRRFLEAQGRRVRYVMNITDFEDKITVRAAALGSTWRGLARREERRFFADLAHLRIEPPTDTPRASEYVPQMIESIRRLDKGGFVDRSEGALVYSPRKNVCNRNFAVGRALDEHIVPEPGAPPPPSDGTAGGFVLWRPQDPPAPSWKSPWGPGMPGWHLECYAMAHRLLGLPVDLHGGGVDLTFPHHFTENEVACSLDQTLFSRSFLHLPFVTQDGQKMAKSTGNLVPIVDALAHGDVDALRWYLLGTPSDQKLEWSEAAYDAAIDRSREVRLSFAAALPNGSGGTVPLAGLRALRRGVEKDVADRLGADRALRRIEAYSDELRARPDGRFRRGDRRSVLAELGGIDRLLGTDLAGASRSGARRAG